MKWSGLLLVAWTCVAAARAADATAPIDYTQRNAPFAPASSVAPEKQTPQANETLQSKRVPTTTVDKTMSPVGDRRSAIDMKEAREKTVREKESQRPEKTEQPTSAFNQRRAVISTADNTTKPPTVAKYQDSLAAASASNMARFPAFDGATTAKINRFVFRKNPTEPAAEAAKGSAAITPAAGGSPIQK